MRLFLPDRLLQRLFLSFEPPEKSLDQPSQRTHRFLGKECGPRTPPNFRRPCGQLGLSFYDTHQTPGGSPCPVGKPPQILELRCGQKSVSPWDPESPRVPVVPILSLTSGEGESDPVPGQINLLYPVSLSPHPFPDAIRTDVQGPRRKVPCSPFFFVGFS